MGFSSQDDLINKITNLGLYRRQEVQKITGVAHTAGGWHTSSVYAGMPPASTFPSTQDLVFQACSELGGDGAGTSFLGIPHGGLVEDLGYTKHISNISALAVAAAGAPWQLKLIDLEGYYRLSGTNVTGTTARTLINTNTFTASDTTDLLTYTNDFASYTRVRFTTTGTLPGGLSAGTDYWLIRQSATTAKVATSQANAQAGVAVDITSTGTGTHTLAIQMRNDNGIGVQAFLAVQTTVTAGGPNISASSYTNSAGVASRAFQGSPSCGAAADGYASRILHSGNAAGRYGPFLPLQGGDGGVQSIQSLTLSGGTAFTAGTLALCLGKPLLDIMLPATGALGERDLINQLMSLPRVRDNACLAWLVFSTGATTASSPITTTLDFVWG